MRYTKFFVVIILGIFLFNCGPKKFFWQGQYTSIQTVKEPKEDFLVNDYIVVGYDLSETNKSVSIPYKFVVLQEEEKVSELFLIDRPSANYMNALMSEGKDIHDISDMMQEGKYYLEEMGPRCEDAQYYLAKSKEYVTYKSYTTMPSYKYVKSDVKTVLLGGIIESE